MCWRLNERWAGQISVCAPSLDVRATYLPRSQRHTSLVVSVREPLAPRSPSYQAYLSRLPVKTTRPRRIPDPSLLHCCQHIARTNFHSASQALWLHRRASLELALLAWMTWWCTPPYVSVLCHPDTLKHILLLPAPLQTSGLLVWRVSHTWPRHSVRDSPDGHSALLPARRWLRLEAKHWEHRRLSSGQRCPHLKAS